MRIVFLDAEATGGDPEIDRIVEIGLVETIGFRPTGRVFQAYFNPHRPVCRAAARLHGLSSEVLADYPDFADRADEVFEFIGSDQVWAHGADFDKRLLAFEAIRAERMPILERQWINTLPMVRTHLADPRGRCGLDFAAEQLGICWDEDRLHGALEDAVFLAAILAEIKGVVSQTFRVSLPCVFCQSCQAVGRENVA